MKSPTEHSLKLLRERGYLCEVVEHWNPFARQRRDLWGIIDILCLEPVNGRIIGVQTTSYGNISARVNKITDSPNLRSIRNCRIEIVVHGWRKVKNRWTVKEVNLS